MRLAVARARLETQGLWREVIEPAPAPREALERVHHPAYLDRLASFGEGWWDADTYVRPETYEIARLAAGGALRAAREAAEHGRPTLALHRPPGHHATASEAMGFCYLNHVAIAAADLRAAGQARVAIVDIDAHHGNGTQAAFYGRPDVLYISTHQDPLYPGTGRADETGEGDGAGFNLNIPLPPGSGDATFDAALERIALPVIEQFGPSAILVSLGADAHYMDPLAHLTLSTPGLLRWVDSLARFARQSCGGRLTVCLEGGYEPEALADVVAGVVAGFAQRPCEARFADVDDDWGRGLAAVAAAARHFSAFWKL
jgi:acetoin utilization deacetylase AcuC-like enzyme